MVKGLYTAHSGLVNEQNRMNTLTNNLANSATTGYKKEGATSQSFDDVLAYKINDNSELVRTSKKLGVNTPGVKVGENYTDYNQGSLKITENPFDVALSGEGFFSVEFTNKAGEVSTKYTRDGSFTMNKDGFLVTKDGDYVLGENGRIQLDPLKETIFESDGSILQDNEIVDQLEIVDFEDYNYIEQYGENYYQLVEGAREIDHSATVNRGALEMSNVQVVTEMVDMIAVTRAYESNQKILQTYDSTLDIAVNQLGKL